MVFLGNERSSTRSRVMSFTSKFTMAIVPSPSLVVIAFAADTSRCRRFLSRTLLRRVVPSSGLVRSPQDDKTAPPVSPDRCALPRINMPLSPLQSLPPSSSFVQEGRRLRRPIPPSRHRPARRHIVGAVSSSTHRRRRIVGAASSAPHRRRRIVGAA